jgi:hypothetical protein
MASLGNSTSNQYGGIVPVPSNTSLSNHRYLDVMTVRPSQAARATASTVINSSQLLQFGNNSRQNTPNASKRSVSSGGTRGSAVSSPSRQPPASTHMHAQTQNLSAASFHQSLASHSSLLIEPILLPNLQHVNVDNVQDLEESRLFYPDGHKNRNIRREIESNVVKHHVLENSKMKSPKKPDQYRIVPKELYADVKGPPLYFTKRRDPEFQQLLKDVRSKEGKILNTIQVRL